MRRTLESLRETFPHDAEFLVVNDGSTDGTTDEVQRFREQDAHTHLITHDRNRGKGEALRSGFAQAQGDLIAFYDADGDIPASDLFRLTLELHDNIMLDAVIGSKRKKGSQRDGFTSPLRKVVARLGNQLIQTLLLPGIEDTQAGAKVFRVHVLQTCLPETHLTKWSFDIELLSLVVSHGFVLKEVPVHWQDAGDTRVKRLDYLWTLIDVWNIHRHLKKQRKP